MQVESRTTTYPLKGAIASAGYRMWEFAALAGIAPHRLSAIANLRANPTPGEARNIADALSLPTGTLFPEQAQ